MIIKATSKTSSLFYLNCCNISFFCDIIIMLNQLNSSIGDIFFILKGIFFRITTLIKFDKMQVSFIVVM